MVIYYDMQIDMQSILIKADANKSEVTFSSG